MRQPKPTACHDANRTMNAPRLSLFQRLVVWVTLLALGFTTLPVHGSLSQARERMIFYHRDGDGNKVHETINGQTFSYLVDDRNPTGYAQVVEELQNGSVIRTYTYGHALLVQDQKNGSGTWNATWYGYDGHGSVRLLTDSLGNVTDRYDYDAFGELLHAEGATFNRHRYCGEVYDDALGLYYLRARLMNPLTGRFWSADSYQGVKRDPLSLHKYLYANINPINAFDPSGNITLGEIVITDAIISAIFISYKIISSELSGDSIDEAKQKKINKAINLIYDTADAKWKDIAIRAGMIRWRSLTDKDGAWGDTKLGYRLVVLREDAFNFETPALAALIVHETTHTLDKLVPFRGLPAKFSNIHFTGEYLAYSQQSEFMRDIGMSGKRWDIQEKYPNAAEWVLDSSDSFEQYGIRNPAVSESGQ